MSEFGHAPVLNDDARGAGGKAGVLRRAPLFRFDPGWLFVMTGLIVCAAGVLLPAQADLHTLRQQLVALQHEEARWYSRLKAHGDFLDQVDREESDLVRRLAASQLNLIPTTETPVLLAADHAPPLTQWIDGSVVEEPLAAKPVPISSLSRLATGPDRLWLFAGGIMCVFVGLLMGPGLARQSRGEQIGEPAAAAFVDGDIDDDVHIELANNIECSEESWLQPEHVQSQVLVEVPPAARTIEAKGTPVPPIESLDAVESTGVRPQQRPAIRSCLKLAHDDDAADAETGPRSVSGEAGDRDGDGDYETFEEALDDASVDADSDAEWPTADSSRVHGSNRFDDADDESSRDRAA